MKIAQITPGLLPIPPKGWGAIEKMIWELHCNFLLEGHDSKIVYLDELTGDEDIVHIHVGNLANMAHERGIPYYFTMSDHHAYLYGKDSDVYKQNYMAMKHSIRSFVGAKFLVDYFDGMPEYAPYGTNTEFFTPVSRNVTQHRLLCVANNGYIHNQAEDRKGFGVALAAAKRLGLPITIAGPKNNQKYFDNNPPNYDKLTIKFDLSEEELLQTYQTHTIFLHPSQLESGHPNLTLVEALACGLPVVGTLEQNNSLDGMQIVNANVDEVVAGITTVMADYTNYTNAAVTQAERLSWKNRAKELLTLYASDKQPDMRSKLRGHYTDTVPLKKTGIRRINVHMVDGLFTEVLGGPKTQYTVKLIDKTTGNIVYDATVGNNSWVRSSSLYFVNWKVEIADTNSDFTYTYEQNLTNQRVFISVESNSLGDTLAWMPYVEEFRLRHNCTVICSTFLNHLFEQQYPHITFVPPGEAVHNIVALYRVGLFYDKNGEIDRRRHPQNPLMLPLQQMASDILGLPYKEIRPRLPRTAVDKDDNLITIAVHSTTQAKYWNNPTGWQDVINWLRNRGYTVKLLSQEPNGFMGNNNPTGVVLHPAGGLDSVMRELQKSKLFIGLGSGLSWLSWALEVPTMIISGFSYPISEMQDCIRVSAPTGSCAGCFNRVRLDAGDWNWCPDHKNTPRQFECSRLITPDMVIRELEKVL